MPKTTTQSARLHQLPGKSCQYGSTSSALPRPENNVLSFLSNNETTKLTITPPTDSPPISLRCPASLHPLSLQTHPLHSLPILRLARTQQPRSAPIRRSEPLTNSRTNPRRPFNPHVRRVQRGYPLRGDHAGALCGRENSWVDPRECVERGGGGDFRYVCLDDGAEGEVCW